MQRAPHAQGDGPEAAPPRTAGDRRWFERHPVVTLLVLVALAVCGLDLLAGSLYRIVRGESFYAQAMNPGRHLNRNYRNASPVFHHGLLADVSMPASWGPLEYPMATNSLGFRDETPREVALRCEGGRLVLIGDSFTEGVGVSFADSFAGLLCAALRPAGVEVLNAGVNSYSPAIYYSKTRYLLETAGLEFDELAVFLDISDAWDEAKSYVLSEDDRVLDRQPVAATPSQGFAQFFRRNSILYGVPLFLKNQKKNKEEAAPRALAALNTSPKACWTFDPKPMADFGQEGLRLMTENMDRLDALAKRHGVRLTVVVYPWPAQILNKDQDSIQERHWAAWCQEHGASFVDLFPLLVSGDAEVNRANIAKYYIPSDMHWNEAGHELVADAFLAAR